MSFVSRISVYLWILAVLSLLFPRSAESNALRFAEYQLQPLPAPSVSSTLRTEFIQETGGPQSVHSGTLTQLRDGTMLAAWFGGTREGAKDVNIYLSRRQSDAAEWSAPTVIASRAQTSADLNRYVSKLGNPVLFADSRERVWLYYVTVSFGGWSGSSISVRYSDDGGDSWSAATRLTTSPFLNVSTLVKGLPLECESGHILLPVYHEFVRKFGEALILDVDGQLVSKVRTTASDGAIQPWIVPLDPVRSQAFYRQSGYTEKVVITSVLPDILHSSSGALEPTTVPNPNSSVAVIRRDNGGFLMVCNPTEAGRNQLTILTSEDGKSWKTARGIEHSTESGEFSYPYLLRGTDGQYHLIYTWNRSRMRYMSFDEQWLEDMP